MGWMLVAGVGRLILIETAMGQIDIDISIMVEFASSITSSVV